MGFFGGGNASTEGPNKGMIYLEGGEAVSISPTGGIFTRGWIADGKWKSVGQADSPRALKRKIEAVKKKQKR